MKFFLIVVLVLLAIIVIGGLVLFYKLSDVWHSLFGNKSLQEVSKEQEDELEYRQKSISNVASLLLPSIQSDFPEFSFEEYRLRTENMIKGCLLAISKQDLSLIPGGANADLKKQIELIIEDDKLNNKQTTYDDIAIYRTGISDYTKRNGACTVVMQTALSFHYYILDSQGKLLEGKKERTTQSKIESRLIYIQDPDKIDRNLAAREMLGLTCPNCGASVRTLGSKHCEYCGAGLIEINIHSWTFGRMKRLV